MSGHLEVELRLERIEYAIRVLARHVIKDERVLRELLKAMAAPRNALSATKVVISP